MYFLIGGSWVAPGRSSSKLPIFSGTRNSDSLVINYPSAKTTVFVVKDELRETLCAFAKISTSTSSRLAHLADSLNRFELCSGLKGKQ